MTGSGSEFMSNPKEAIDPNENLWNTILAEVQTKGSNKLPSNKSILVLGDNESGKTTLIAKLQGVEDPKKGSGLEYAYIDVRDEYRDDQTKLSVWVLDGHPAHSQLLRFALSPPSLPHTLVMLVASMTTPWSILEQLKTWANVLRDHIKSQNIASETMEEYRLNMIRRWEEYVEVGDETDVKKKSVDEPDMPLSEGVLTTNLGLDIVVVITKTDYMSTLEKENDYRDEHFDFMQQWIRRFCLEYGAALFYTSAKEDKNCDLLYKYLTHRLYNLPFRTPALVVEKEALLIPSGWDSMKKISIVCENLQSMKPDDFYRDIIASPVTRKSGGREVEVVSEDEQVFLSRMLAMLQQGSTDRLTPGGGAAVQKTSDRRAPPLTSPKKMDTSKVTAGAGGEGVLANFFNSLLNKKTGSPSPIKQVPSLDSCMSLDKSMRVDAAAELDRLTRSKPSLTETNSVSSNSLDSSNC